MRVVKRLIAGARWSEAYGSHPGTEWLFLFVAIGVLAGSKEGSSGALLGGLGMLLFMGPLWLVGCWERGSPPEEQG